MIEQLKEQVTIQEPIRVQDGIGGFSTTFKDLLTMQWAGIFPAGGKELFFAQKLEMRITHKIVMRFTPQIKAKMRILFGTRIFKVMVVTNRDERGRWTDLLCEEGSGN